MVDITLNNSMRSNLLSLQNVSRLQDIASNRLATGLKVNSAIDNPSSYYTARSLADRASDLQTLLDSMSQGIQTIKAASEALKSGTAFLQQAKALVGQALENTNTVVPDYDTDYNGPVAAVVTNEVQLLDALTKVNPVDGAIVIANDIALSKNVGLVMNTGQRLVGQTGKEQLTFDFDSAVKAIGIDLAQDSKVSGLKINYTSVNKTNGTDFHAIRNNGFSGIMLKDLEIVVKSNDTVTYEMSGIYNAGLGEITLAGKIKISAPDVNNRFIYGIYNNDISSKLVQTTSSILDINTSGEYGYGIVGGTNTLLGTVNITTLGHYSRGISGGNNILTGTVGIKTSGNYGYGIFGMNSTVSSSGQLLIKTENVTSNALSSVKLSYQNGAKIGIDSTVNSVGSGFWQATADKISTTSETIDTLGGVAGWNRIGDFPRISAFAGVMTDILADSDLLPASELEAAAASYNLILEQFNQLINDASYKGINLLKGNSLKINFNEDSSSFAEVKGREASTAALGLNEVNWNNLSDIENTVNELENAINKLRAYASEFGNYYNIIANREDFTENLINVLTEGADKLTLADMNQESANMLALQTRQQLAVNSLSLASQASQSILKLF